MNLPLLHIPAGDYQLGDASLPLSRPVHSVSLEAFDIMQMAVTNAHYAEFLAKGGYEQERFWSKLGWRWQKSKGDLLPAFWGNSRFDNAEKPVVGIAWYEALAFANWLSAESGEHWRLPSEAQWEVAAQGGGSGRIHTAASGLAQTIPVHQGYQSTNGAWNLLGNVWEWCSTIWGHNWQSLDYPYPYKADDGRESLDGSAARVMRGGSWFDASRESHPAQRARYLPGSRGSNIGFRLVKLGAG
jgi:formylglycine-generating enzyme required for sulfatase activity